MLTNRFDYTVAYYNHFEEVDAEEVKAADLVTILGKHSGGIYHPISMRWKCFLKNQQSSEIIRSQKERQSLEKNKQYFIDQGYTFQVKEMNESDYYEFEALYNNTVQKKIRAVRYTLKDKILGRILVEVPVYCAGMYKEGALVSGLIFSITDKKEALISFGAKQKFQEVRGGVGGVLEWNLIQYCVEHDIKVIDHGKSFNPTGLIAKAGLFEFKARYGNSAFPEGEWLTSFILNPTIVLSDMVFVTTINDQVGYTIVTEESSENVHKKYLTNLVTNTEVLSLSKVVESARNTFKLGPYGT